MKLPAGRLSRKTIRGFSLVELLLAITLILLLLGAVVFNFTSIQQGAELDEGATQIESLIRFAKAHAANTGRRVRMTFEEDVGDGLLVPIGNLEVSWEPDPLGLPEQFVPLPETATYVKTILDLVTIENVLPFTGAGPAAVSSVEPLDTQPGSTTAAASVSSMDEEDVPFGFPPITFYPDGSSDSAEITLAPRNEDGEIRRRIAIRLVGLTGAIRRRAWNEEESMSAEEPPSEIDSGNSAEPGGVGQ